MKLLHLAKITFFRRLRDRQELLTSIFLPLVLIFILGTALQGSFGAGELGDIPVAYLNQDSGPGGQAFDEFLKDDEISRWLRIVPVDSHDRGLELIDRREVLSFIHLPEDFSQGLALEEQRNIRVYDAGLSELLPSVVNNILRSYTQGGNLLLTLMMMEGTTLDFQEGETWEPVSDVMAEERGEPIEPSLIRRNTLEGGTEQMSGMDYYAVTMLVMFIMWGIFSGAQSLTEDLFTPMKFRIHSAPVGKFNYFLGKSLGVFTTFFVQILVIILFTRGFYGVTWGQSLGPILAVSMVLSFVAITMGIAIGVSAPSESTSAMIINGFVIISTFVAGGFFPIEMEGSLFRIIRSLSPNYHAQQGIFNVVYNGSGAAIRESILALLAISALCLLIGLYRGRRIIHEDF